VRIALMADIHANREAFEACLEHAGARGTDRFVFVGDYVGYGADPAWVVAKVMELVQKGAVAVLGNHDLAVSDVRESMNSDAEVALSWTRGQLGAESREFLATLPMRFEDDNRLYVHASPQTYPKWPYVDSVHAAQRALEASRAQSVFCGHVHVPALYGISATGRTVAFQPVPGIAIPLPRHRRWFSVLGSVGQPRDGNTSAAYAQLDTVRSEITFHRVAYDVDMAAAKVQAAGLPRSLSERLVKGA
jgi:diadenosine tetraphosphatase ApaH/serine/threonine PP2A family protein phosphatase